MDAAGSRDGIFGIIRIALVRNCHKGSGYQLILRAEGSGSSAGYSADRSPHMTVAGL